MFSKYFSTLKIERALKDNHRVSMKGVREILSRNSILGFEGNVCLNDFGKLIMAYDDDHKRGLIIQSAKKMRKVKWNNRLFLMPPLYISSGDKKRGGCLDHCVYCQWHNGNVPKEKIVRMDYKEVQTETKLLLNIGYGDVELVSATDPVLFDGKSAGKYVRASKEAGAQNIGINFFPLKSAADYSALAKAGCTFVIVWQETYSASTYQKMHPSGPKSNMEYRLNAHDRALQGGIKTVGVAFLGGLSDWRYEAISTIAHAKYLREEYRANIIFGMPRWKKGASANISPYPYDDQMYEFVGALYSLAIPESLPWFSTREDFSLSAKAAQGGGCIFTLDCSTEVGGYSHKNNTPQFPVFSKSYKEGVKWLNQIGFKTETHLPFGDKKGE